MMLATLLVSANACGRFPAPQPGQRLQHLAGTAHANALPTRGLGLLVWNIKKAQEPRWHDDFTRLAPGVQLVLLQEAYDTPTFARGLATRADMQWQMGVSFAYASRGNTATGVATGSVAPSVFAEVVHAPKREPIVPTPKAALITTYPLQGRPDRLLVVNIHAINFRRAKHLDDQLAALGDIIKGHDGPVLLAGDLNTHHRPRMMVVERFAERHGLTSVFPNWLEGPGRRKPIVDGRMRFGRWPLDHIYCRGLSATGFRIHPEIVGSDHKPLIVQFDVHRRR